MYSSHIKNTTDGEQLANEFQNNTDEEVVSVKEWKFTPPS